MKKLEEIPQEVLDLIQTEHERALRLLSGQSPVLTIPTRQVKMRIERPGKGYSLEDVIIPETLIYYSGDDEIEDGYCNTSSIRYHLAITKEPFPYGHIYRSSGSVCLGGIFVPSRVSIYNLSQPLEALFLRNDHNTGHGGSQARVTIDETNEIFRILAKNKIKPSKDAMRTLQSSVNLISNDAVWILSADVRDQVTLEQSIRIMDEIFQIIFKKKDEGNSDE